MADYPRSRRSDDVEGMHGESIADPYRWLEDTYSPETEAWVREQNRLTESVLARCVDRDEIRRRLTEVLDVTTQSAPHRRGERWFFTRKVGLADQPVLVVADHPSDPGRVLLDPNTLSSTGTMSLAAWSIDSEGTRLAYGVSDAGSDWVTWRVRDVITGTDLPDVVEWSKFSSAAWLPDASGFFYGAMDSPTSGEEFLEASQQLRVQLHRLGTPVVADELIYVDPDPEWMPSFHVTDDGRWLVIELSPGTSLDTRVRVVDLAADDRVVTALIDAPVAGHRVIGNDGHQFLVLTDHEAPRRRVVSIDRADPEVGHWREVVPQSPDLLVDTVLARGHLICHRLHDASSLMEIWPTTASTSAAGSSLPRPVELPDMVTVLEMAADAGSDDCHLALTGFADPGTIVALRVSTGDVQVVHSATVDTPCTLVTERAHATSADGTDVPMFLVHRSDVTPTGDTRTYLYGYGGFDIPLTPTFSAANLVWVERGGLLAVANLRGGGEFGKEWYDAGRREHKQNVFDDFAGCARWLSSSGWTRAGRIVVNGRSNGGLLVGATLVQHPELIGAAVPEVGVLDLLRFHRFTIGWAWMDDYGDPDDSEEYQWVRAYSPLHNITDGAAYPPVLVTTGDHDDRVVPGHSFKFTAALQAAVATDAGPVLIRVETAAGHGAGKPTSKVIEERADVLAFCEAALSGRLSA